MRVPNRRIPSTSFLLVLLFCAAAVAVLVLRSSGETLPQAMDVGPQADLRR